MSLADEDEGEDADEDEAYPNKIKSSFRIASKTRKIFPTNKQLFSCVCCVLCAVLCAVLLCCVLCVLRASRCVLCASVCESAKCDV